MTPSIPPLSVHRSTFNVERSPNLLKDLDYSIVQQCMHCGMCLPTCPTYDLTKLERHSPRGRIALMRAVADDRLEVGAVFGEEMYYCLGCLACQTACPAGVDYANLFEHARAEVERTRVLDSPRRRLVRLLALRFLFGRQWAVHLFGRCIRLYQVSGLKTLLRRSGLLRLLPATLRHWESMTPEIESRFSHQLIAADEPPRPIGSETAQYTVGLLTGCVQDIMYAGVNRDTADVLRASGCRVLTPRGQLCCGSLHAHNGDLEAARDFARRLIDQFDLDHADAIITNAGGCGSHLKHYARLLADDPAYIGKARLWDSKLRDIHEWLVEIGFDPAAACAPYAGTLRITYHDSCHLAHGQGITHQPRRLLAALPGVELIELPEASWCCGSAGVYNLTQPATAAQLSERKLNHILSTGCGVVATANPGCLLQLQNTAAARGVRLDVCHPISLLARSLRQHSS